MNMLSNRVVQWSIRWQNICLSHSLEVQIYILLHSVFQVGICDIFLALWPCASLFKKIMSVAVIKYLWNWSSIHIFPIHCFITWTISTVRKESKSRLCNKSLKGCNCQQQYFKNHWRQTNSHSFIGNIKPIASAKIQGLRELTNILTRPKGMSKCLAENFQVYSCLTPNYVF